jgi:hypothetical protein
MDNARRYAVFGILDASTALLVRPLQVRVATKTGNDLALRFPIHVTLRGRFWGLPDAVTETFQMASIEGWTACELTLSGPVFRAPDLLWLSVEMVGAGYSELVRLHENLERALKPVVSRDETLSAHSGVGYRPHVTLAWGATEEAIHHWELPAMHSVRAELAGVTLAEYPETWPASGTVEPVCWWEKSKGSV